MKKTKDKKKKQKQLKTSSEFHHRLEFKNSHEKGSARFTALTLGFKPIYTCFRLRGTKINPSEPDIGRSSKKKKKRRVNEGQHVHSGAERRANDGVDICLFYS